MRELGRSLNQSEHHLRRTPQVILSLESENLAGEVTLRVGINDYNTTSMLR